MKRSIIVVAMGIYFCMIGAGCGSSSNDVNLGGGSGGGESGAGVWDVRAAVATDGCGERISDVRQTFTINDDGNDVVVDTDLVTINAVKEGAGFIAGFEESNGNCNRSYEVIFSEIGATTANVQLIAKANCSGQVCQNKWTGTATKTN